MRKKALLIPGFSESEAFVDFFRAALEDKNDGLYDEVRVATLRQALINPAELNETAKTSDLITHSLGLYAVKKAVAQGNGTNVFALNAPERNTIPRTMFGAVKVFLADNDQESQIDFGTAIDEIKSPLIEIAKKPSLTVMGPVYVRDFSSAEYLAHAHDVFPGGRYMMQTEHDEFGFTRPVDMRFAIENGVNAWTVPGLHNQPMYQPSKTVELMSMIIANEQPPAPSLNLT